MHRGFTSRRIAALLTATLVAMLVVVVGGSAQASTDTASVGSSHQSSTVPVARTVHSAAAQHAATYPHLDLTTAPSTSAAPTLVRSLAALTKADASDGQRLVARIGRAPPAL